MLDYIELFVFESGCHCLEHGIMHTEVNRQSRVDETSPEWILWLALVSDNGAMLTDVIGLIVGTVIERTLLMHLEMSQLLTFLM